MCCRPHRGLNLPRAVGWCLWANEGGLRYGRVSGAISDCRWRFWPAQWLFVTASNVPVLSPAAPQEPDTEGPTRGVKPYTEISDEHITPSSTLINTRVSAARLSETHWKEQRQVTLSASLMTTLSRNEGVSAVDGHSPSTTWLRGGTRLNTFRLGSEHETLLSTNGIVHTAACRP